MAALRNPHAVILAGPNGAGKSTLAPWLLADALCVHTFRPIGTEWWVYQASESLQHAPAIVAEGSGDAIEVVDADAWKALRQPRQRRTTGEPAKPE